jgi:hypothetical protein
MAKNTTPYMLKADVYTRTTFVNADGTTVKDICTAGADGSYVYLLQLTGDNTTTRDITLFMHDGTNEVPIKLATVAINQGNVIATPDPLRLIQPASGFVVGRLLDRDQNYYIPLPAGCKLRMRVNTAVASGQTITVLTHRKDF